LELRGDRKPIGGLYAGESRDYQNQSLLLDTGDVLYLSTDGFMDQANPQRDSFGKQRVKELILENYQKPMNIQKVIFENALAAHQAEAEQRDDITVLGFKF
jgi:serine phosphatase RsbU (regulator of sigma subunit)